MGGAGAHGGEGHGGGIATGGVARGGDGGGGESCCDGEDPGAVGGVVGVGIARDRKVSTADGDVAGANGGSRGSAIEGKPSALKDGDVTVGDGAGAHEGDGAARGGTGFQLGHLRWRC